jgi:subtilisin family serine protease/PKD repeat protein
MKKVCVFISILGLVILFTSSVPSPEKGKARKSMARSENAVIGQNIQVWPGMIVIKFKENTRINEASEKPVKTGIGSIDEKLSIINASGLKKRFLHQLRQRGAGLPDLSRIYRLTFPESYDPQEVAELFRGDPNVEYAVPEQKMQLMDMPDDPMYPDQQHLPQVMAEQAWTIHKGENGQEEVVVAIVDTGVEWYHDDLQNNTWQNLGEDSDEDGHTVEMSAGELILDPGDVNGIDDDGNGFTDDLIGWDFYEEMTEGDGSNPDPNESNSVGFHGTHCAGIAAATSDNGIGVSGISWNIKYMAVQADENNTLTWGWEGIIYAADMGADIISCSWGGPITELDPFVTEIIAYAKNSGCNVVCAAGNENHSRLYSPAHYPGVIGVASVNGDDTRTGYSNYAPGVDVSAPGGGLEGGILSAMPGNSYDVLWGTSMATPLVAGLMGLVKSYHPDWTNDQVAAQVIATCDNIDTLNPMYGNMLGSGRINAFRALAETGSTPPQELKLEMLEYTVTDSDNDFILGPGEVVTLSLKLRNFTHFVSSNAINFHLSADDDQIDINVPDYTGTIDSDTVFNFPDILQFTISEEATTHATALKVTVAGEIPAVIGNELIIPVAIAPSGFFVYEKEAFGRDYSGTYICQYFDDRGYDYTYSNYFPASLLGFDAVFLSMGNLVYPNWDPGTVLTVDMVQTLTNYLETGGKMYIEGGGVFVIPWEFGYWNFNLLKNIFGINMVTYNWNSNYNPIEKLTGSAGTIGEGIEFTASSQYNNFYIDNITPKTGAICPFSEYGYGNVSIYNTGQFGQKTFFMAYSLADLKDADTISCRYTLMNRIMEFLGYPLIGDYLTANFTADCFAGGTDTEVQFMDISLLSGSSELMAEWDFENDGIIDATGLYPKHTFTSEGVYDVRMVVTDGIHTDTLVQEHFFTVNKGILVYESYEGCIDMSGAWMRDFLLEHDYGVTYVNEIPRHIDGYYALFLSFGSQSSYYSTFENGLQKLIEKYLGKKGKVYLEGSSALGVDQNDPPTWQLFGLQNVINPFEFTNVLDTLTGQPASICSGLNFYESNQDGQWFIDKYNPNSQGKVAFVQPGYGNVAVQHTGTHGEKTFCFSYSLAELQDGESTREDLMWAILDFFDIITASRELEKPSGALNLQVYPIPTAERLTITFAMPSSGQVTLEIYDISGKRVWINEDGILPAGPASVFISIDAPAGIYFLRVQAANAMEIRKIVKY